MKCIYRSLETSLFGNHTFDLASIRCPPYATILAVGVSDESMGSVKYPTIDIAAWPNQPISVYVNWEISKGDSLAVGKDTRALLVESGDDYATFRACLRVPVSNDAEFCICFGIEVRGFVDSTFGIFIHPQKWNLKLRQDVWLQEVRAPEAMARIAKMPLMRHCFLLHPAELRVMKDWEGSHGKQTMRLARPKRSSPLKQELLSRFVVTHRGK